MLVDNDKLKEKLKDLTLLYVEDELKLLELTAKMLSRLFKRVDTAKDGLEAMKMYEENSYDIIITDINMPKLDGLELSKNIRSMNPEQAIIITTAFSDSQKLLESIKLGIDSYIIKPIDMEQLFSALQKVSNEIINRKENAYYKNNLEKIIEQKVRRNLSLEEEKIQNYEETILALVNMVEIRDSYTSGHSLRVANYSKLIVEELGLSKEEVDIVYQAGILHDIGKIAIPDSILLKPNALNNFEFNLMKKHAVMSYEILNKIPMYKDLSLYVKHHHERYDGSGYPDGLKGDEIRLYSQVMAIADTFDAMTTSRIYKPRKDKFEAIEELKSLANISFEKELLEVAVKVFKDVELDIEVNQNPISEFEEQRFSFFYKDKLTNLYNVDYLDLVLNKNKHKIKKRYLTSILLHNFGEYNKTNSWEKGDDLLVKFSSYLKKSFNDENLIFRFRGDDFLILSNKDFKEIDITFLEDYDITIDVKFIDLNENEITSYSKFNDYLDNMA